MGLGIVRVGRSSLTLIGVFQDPWGEHTGAWGCLFRALKGLSGSVEIVKGTSLGEAS